MKLVLQLEGIPIDIAVGWDSFLEAGLENQFSEGTLGRGDSFSERSVATILYTSGTTGKPKGVPLSHANLLHQMRSIACVANPPAGSSVLSVLPIWHSYERSAEYYFFSCACTQSYTTIKNLKNFFFKETQTTIEYYLLSLTVTSFSGGRLQLKPVGKVLRP